MTRELNTANLCVNLATRKTRYLQIVYGLWRSAACRATDEGLLAFGVSICLLLKSYYKFERRTRSYEHNLPAPRRLRRALSILPLVNIISIFHWNCQRCLPKSNGNINPRRRPFVGYARKRAILCICCPHFVSVGTPSSNTSSFWGELKRYSRSSTPLLGCAK